MPKLTWRAALAAAVLVLALPSQVWAAGQSLKETLGFIRDRIAGQGQVSYSIRLHDSADGSDWGQAMTGEASRVVYDVGACTLSYHWRTSTDGASVQDFDVTWYFKNGKKVGVVSREQELRTQAIDGGHSTWTAVVTPPLWVVTVTFTDHTGVANFTDQSTAERVARAIDHVMDLCGAPKEGF